MVRRSIDDELSSLGWKIAFTTDRQPYFYHKLSGKASWLIPDDVDPMNTSNLSEDKEDESIAKWKKVYTEDKRAYYYNVDTRETSWKM